MTRIESTDRATEQRDALVGRLFEAAIGAMEVATIYTGDRLGLYQALDEAGPATPSQIAAAAGIHERYAREWLEQQAVAGILAVEDPAAEATERRYLLPAAYREIFLERDSLNYLGGLLRLVVGASRPLDAVLAAYRTGGGVPYPDFGVDTREGIAAMNRPMFVNLLGSEWLPAMADIHARLQADPPARVADIGCGTGWSSIAIARAYPTVTVEGFDLDDASIAQARRNVAGAGLAGRVTFHIRDAADPELVGRYDLVTAFETIHDIARPVEALRVMRGLLADGGAVLIAD
ncbi:MAG: class I SAM-dependent methyltransferase, partial [Dehalococcoidia bacterium]